MVEQDWLLNCILDLQFERTGLGKVFDFAIVQLLRYFQSKLYIESAKRNGLGLSLYYQIVVVTVPLKEF
jgi:hypothetical protein